MFKIFEMIAKAKEWLRGKKVYTMGLTTILGALIAWSNNVMDTKTFIETIWGALGVMALRAGQENAAVKAITALPSQIGGNEVKPEGK